MKLVRLLLVLLLAGLGACARLQPRPALPTESASPPGETTRLDRMMGVHEERNANQSAFRLIREGPEAFMVRVQSARLAERSIDVQTYIWHADLTGAFLVLQLLEAADRGVRVRLLVDDIDARAKNAGFAALAAHERVSVRMFNPFASRKGTLSLVGEGLSSFGRVNHRMHNKTWIADNRVAVVGGRNLGDEYFGASDELNFVDLDFAMIGPVVRDASDSFDRYWNSEAAYPIELLDPVAVSQENLTKLRAWLAETTRDADQSRYAGVLRQDDAVQRMIAGDWPMEWSANYQFVADDPLKATLPENDPGRSRVVAALVPAMNETRERLLVVSPYFVPGERGTATLVGLAQSGKHVSVLTNSLAANDVAAVHGGYSRYREALLEGGVLLFERKPIAGIESHSSIFGSSGASLHTKALVVDDRTLFVGSYNLDPRSTFLNCEQGVLVESKALARQFQDIVADQTASERAWQVTIDDGDLHWSDGVETFERDPGASPGRRFQAWLTRVLRLDAQL